MPHHVFLIPGFFGFDSLGDLAYFIHVVEALADHCRDAQVDVRFHVVTTLPTASLRHRAALLLEEIHRHASDDGPIHLVGHSSGGLDARLVVTPEVSLPGEIDPEPIARRVQSVVTVATPHHGTPTAAFFSSMLGQQLLESLSVATSFILRTGRLPADVLARLTAFFVRPDAATALPSESLRKLDARLYADMATPRRQPLRSFVDQIRRDQDLLPQISPAAMDLFNASTDDRAGVRYGSVVTSVRGSAVRGFLSAGISPYAHGSHVLFMVLSRLAARMPADRAPTLLPHQRAVLERDLGSLPARTDNDGIVPTCSQPWGTIIRAVSADHLDVIGHFDHPTHLPPHFDWLTSGGGFDRGQFVGLWRDVGRFLFAAA